ncbi:MAG: stage II sporulation protein R [Peptococcaceae bacterium]|nr:stage II sporulation protein R [Peptococcaceae bacterium]
MNNFTSYFFGVHTSQRGFRAIPGVMVLMVMVVGLCAWVGVCFGLEGNSIAVEAGRQGELDTGNDSVRDMENLGPENLIRFHILANSDSEADQELKYAVRDAVVALVGPRLAVLNDLDEARRELGAVEDMILDCAEEVIRQHGFSYPIALIWEEREFPMRAYGNVILPAGKYEAVRILIGEAEGANWWCVLFPPLCFVQELDPEPGSSDMGQANSIESFLPQQCQKKSFFKEFARNLFGG